jgi:hypothetical protein
MYSSTQILMHFYFIKSQEYSLTMKIICYYADEFKFFMNFLLLLGLILQYFKMKVHLKKIKSQTISNYFQKIGKISKIYIPFNIYKELVLSLFY